MVAEPPLAVVIGLAQHSRWQHWATHTAKNTKIRDALPRQQHNNPWATPRAESHHNSERNLTKQQQQQTQTDHDTDRKPKTISDTGPETPKLLILILPQNYLVYFPLSPSPENY